MVRVSEVTGEEGFGGAVHLLEFHRQRLGGDCEAVPLIAMFLNWKSSWDSRSRSAQEAL